MLQRFWRRVLASSSRVLLVYLCFLLDMAALEALVQERLKQDKEDKCGCARRREIE